jgi:Xaa-Pro aminopeptidase
MDFLSRQKQLREYLATTRFDGLLISHLPNVRYLCGFTGSAGLLLVEAAANTFFTDVRYDTQAHQEVTGAEVVIANKSPWDAAAAWVSEKHGKARHWTIGIEANHVTITEKKRFNDGLPARVRAKDAPPQVERARMVKDKEELDCIRAAVKLGASLFDRALEVLRPGVKETEVAAEMEYAARRAGAEQMSFLTIIASGARSALPHGRASDQPIARSGFVVCDFGVILAGYCSDQTRTVWVGEESSEAQQAYEAVLAAQLAAIHAVRPGVSVATVDSAAREVLREARLDKNFTHSTGHGVGLEIHESPRVASGQKQVLQPGMVITIEPGVYFPGQWGIRIEDMVAVTPQGCEVLTPTSKEFLAV